MKKLKLFLFLFLVVPFFKGQESYEMSLGYNFPLDKIDLNYQYYTILKQSRNGFTFNYAVNFREDKLVNPKLGLAYNYNSAYVKYGKNDTSNSVIDVKSISRKMQLLQFNSIVKFNLSDFGAFKISPQIGLNVNFLSRDKYENVSSQETYISLKNKAVFYLDLISGFQFEKGITENLSFLVDLNFIRKFYIWDRTNAFYDSKNEFRLSAGIKHGISNKIVDKNLLLVHITSSVFETFYSFENDHDYYSLPSWVNSIDYKSSSLFQKGFSFAVNIEKNRFIFSNEFYFSKIDLNFVGERRYHYLYKMPSPFLIGEEDVYKLNFKASKNEFECLIGFGYKLFKNSRFNIIPQVALFYRANYGEKRWKDEYSRHQYSEYNYFNQSPPQYVLEDTTTYGKASEFVTFDSPSSSVKSKLSFLFNFEISKSLNIYMRLSRLINPENYFNFGYIHDAHKYQIGFGLSYKIK